MIRPVGGSEAQSRFGYNLVDADNHYWETSEAFTRYRDPAFSDRGVVLREVKGSLRYIVHGEQHPIIPGPGDVQPRPKPGALYDYFAGTSDKGSIGEELVCESPGDHPEWFRPDARLAVMDSQGIDVAWLFPSQGVTMEGPMQPDIDASVEIFRAFNRWLNDDWGFAYEDRIFGVPFLTLSDPDAVVAELQWVLERGARIVTIRNGPVFTREGTKSPSDPLFDPFWNLVQEANVVVAPHAGFDDGYGSVEDLIARIWGYPSSRTGMTGAVNYGEPYVTMVMKHRLVHDFAGVLVSQKLFERFPRIRVAYIENGGTWVPNLLHGLQLMDAQNPGMFASSPVDQFIDHCWVAPFVEDSVSDLAKVLPAERILFGSDWPHAEGLSRPVDFANGLRGFSEHDRRLILRENTLALTQGS